MNKNRYDVERISCEERYGDSKATGPIIRFRILRNGLPIAGLYDFFDQAEAAIEREKRPIIITPAVPSASNPPTWTATIDPPPEETDNPTN
jgi:hypothetical protein